MLSVLLWVLVGIVFLGVIVFPGKRKGTLPLSDRKTMISDAPSLLSIFFPLSTINLKAAYTPS